MLKQVFSALGLMSLLVGCVTLDSSKNWPSDIPDRAIFVDNFLDRTNPDATARDIERHLVWIKRFYHGSIIYPLGWNEMIMKVVNSLDHNTDRVLAKQQLDDLGLKISLEWSLKNNMRNITSSNIATWGSALRTSVERKEQLVFIEKVEQDVNQLLSGHLSSKQISRERYYPPEDYDNF